MKGTIDPGIDNQCINIGSGNDQAILWTSDNPNNCRVCMYAAH